MKTKFRKTGYDILPVAPKPDPQDNPGAIPSGKVPVYDGKGRHRGTVGPKATAATASRFNHQLGSKLGTKDGRPAWIGPTLAEVSAKGSHAPGSSGDDIADISSKGATQTKIAGQLAQAKGSTA
jgi:hypothetical protein